MEKDYYSETVGLKPKWVVEKYSKKEGYIRLNLKVVKKLKKMFIEDNIKKIKNYSLNKY